MNLISARKEIQITLFILVITLLLSIFLPAAYSQNISSSKSEAGINNIIPNPFSDKAMINYSLPARIQSAYLRLTDSQGRVLKFIELHQGDSRQMEIKSAGLPVGIYYYSLIVNGRTIDTKQLILIS